MTARMKTAATARAPSTQIPIELLPNQLHLSPNQRGRLKLTGRIVAQLDLINTSLYSHEFIRLMKL